MSAFCVFCYQATDTKITTSSGIDFNSTANNVVKTFPNLLNRFINVANHNGSSGPTNLLKLTGLKWLSCCVPCKVTIDGFCEDFHKLKCLEIAMEWKLQRLKDRMEYAGRVPSRWFKLQHFCQVQKNLEASTGNNENMLEHLKSYRENILKKWTRRLSESKPCVLIKPCDNYDRSPTQSISDDDCGVQTQQSYSSCPNVPAGIVKVENDDAIAENCLLFEEDKEYMTTRKLKQDHDSDKNWSDDNNYPSEDEGNSSTDDNCDTSDDKHRLSADDKTEDTFQCIQSKKTFLATERLNVHKRKVHCKPICKKVLKVGQVQRKHQTRHINGDKIACQSTLHPIPCPKCGKMFASKLRLKDHLNKFHAPLALKCPKCPQMYKTKDNLRKHEIRAHSDPSSWKFKCSFCDIHFVYNSSLLTHTKKHHTDPQTWNYKCAICEKPFSGKTTMLEHMETHWGTEETTPEFDSVNDPAISSFPLTVGPVRCKKCSKIFANKDSIYDHLRRFHAACNIKCSKCTKKFKTKDHLRKHQVRVHTDPKTWKLKCSFCDMRFIYNSTLQAHLRKHQKEERARIIKMQN